MYLPRMLIEGMLLRNPGKQRARQLQIREEKAQLVCQGNNDSGMSRPGL